MQKRIRLHRIRLPLLALLMVVFWFGWGFFEARSEAEAWRNRALFVVTMAVLVVVG